MSVTTTRIDRTDATRHNPPLVAARAFAGVLAGLQLAGMSWFLVFAPEEAVWVGPWVDYPVLVWLSTAVLLKVVLAVGPRLDVRRRIAVGLTAVALGLGVTLVKIPVYGEPEGVTLLVLDAVLLALLLSARRRAAA